MKSEWNSNLWLWHFKHFWESMPQSPPPPPLQKWTNKNLNCWYLMFKPLKDYLLLKPLKSILANIVLIYSEPCNRHNQMHMQVYSFTCRWLLGHFFGSHIFLWLFGQCCFWKQKQIQLLVSKQQLYKLNKDILILCNNLNSIFNFTINARGYYYSVFQYCIFEDLSTLQKALSANIFTSLKVYYYFMVMHTDASVCKLYDGTTLCLITNHGCKRKILILTLLCYVW